MRNLTLDMEKNYVYLDIWHAAEEVGFDPRNINQVLEYGRGHWNSGYDQKKLCLILNNIGRLEMRDFLDMQ